MTSAVAFVAVSATINKLCFWLSPVALIIIFFYSVTKRFTALYFFLGLALSVSPVGAWLAVRGEFAFPPLVLALAVLLWVAGFDIIYATLDREFDAAEGLRSSGEPRTRPQFASRGTFALEHARRADHFFGIVAQLGAVYFGSLVLVAAAIVFEHRSAKRLDPVAVNKAFFSSNAFVSVVIVAAVEMVLSARGFFDAEPAAKLDRIGIDGKNASHL